MQIKANLDTNSFLKDTGVIESKEFEKLNKNFSEFQIDFKEKACKTEPKFLGASYDTVFTVATTIFIFVLGIILDRVIKKFQENRELKQYREYFLNQIDDIIKVVGPTLLKGYRQNYQIEIGIDQGIPTTPPEVFTNCFERLLKMEFSKLFKSFKSNEKEQFNKYFDQIDFLSNLIAKIGGYHSILLNRSEILRNAIAKLDYNYINSLIEFIQFEKDDKKNPSVILVNQKLEIYYNRVAGNRNLELYYKEIIRPIQDHFVKGTDFLSHPVAKKIAELGKDFSHKYNDLRLFTIEVRIQYRSFSISIDKSLKKLEALKKETK